jgi:hypothetical protein
VNTKEPLRAVILRDVLFDGGDEVCQRYDLSAIVFLRHPHHAAVADAVRMACEPPLVGVFGVGLALTGARFPYRFARSAMFSLRPKMSLSLQ